MSHSIQSAISIRNQPLADIRLDPKNPRAHSKRQVQQIAKSIQTFGFNVPILVDANLNVIAGHGRVMACRELGLIKVPTISLDHLTPAQAKAYMIADNRLTENSTWDDKLLAENLKELSILDLDFQLDVIGFDMGEIDFRIQGLDADVDSDPADVLPAPVLTAVSKPGDLWLLGLAAVGAQDAVRAEEPEVAGFGYGGKNWRRQDVGRVFVDIGVQALDAEVDLAHVETDHVSRRLRHCGG